MAFDAKAMRRYSDKVSIVGIGETDYAADWKSAHIKGSKINTGLSLGLTAFERALADSGLRREDIDGLSLTVRGSTPEESLKGLGIKPKYLHRDGMGGMVWTALPGCVEALADGRCDTIALVWGISNRSDGTVFGGAHVQGNIDTQTQGSGSYYYYHPWGWSSQGAHWALAFKHYQQRFGATEDQLGQVAVSIRKHAMLNKNAIFQMPLTIEDHRNSRYICRPLHLFDYCLVNDGGVCIILQRSDMAKDRPHRPVEVAGWGGVPTKTKSMSWLINDLFQSYLGESSDQAYEMAGMTHRDIQHLQPYDNATNMVPLYIEGFGFCKLGEGLEFCQNGNIEIGGKLPVNTSGGMLSESYMLGWNHVVEATRQLRHEAGPRQVKNIETSMFCHCSMIGSYPIIFKRAA